ncbi:uncharacterized protein (TIGR00255 family) [Melghirimyces profundicolus]|uniref:Uncharacterized protein (TIGR00255 family) n=1 Tax=Melghirimyces profundicolus TaxID=1242148 RepID=A0A2T6BYS1_9BACL|nr:YicC/YloC family endoribonuclease [Melghirimyces profundicolus]PTX61212.1 uncharacterized protein (TIGR00255 family) [Melghirimyces profundicolus]
MDQYHIRSMTGYGRGVASSGDLRFTVEIRSVNHRFLELTVRLPAGWGSLENDIKNEVRKTVRRGRVDVTVTVEGKKNSQRKLAVDWNAVEELREAARVLREKWGVEGTLTLSDLLQHPEVLRVEEPVADPEEWGGTLLDAVKRAVGSLSEMRKREGDVLAQDLARRINTLRVCVKEIRKRAPEVVAEYRRKLEERIRELLDGTDPDPERLLTETAIFADKADIQEELTRLSSHFDLFSDTLKQEEPTGRRLDFLLQEMNREINTIGSKANDAAITERVVDCKSELEKMREQVQNIE